MNETDLDVTRGGPTGFISILDYKSREHDRFAEQHQLVSGLNEEIAILDACLDDAVFLHKRALREYLAMGRERGHLKSTLAEGLGYTRYQMYDYLREPRIEEVNLDVEA